MSAFTNFFSGISDAISQIISGFQQSISTVITVFENLSSGLDYVDDTIVAMSQFSISGKGDSYQYPVVQAVATVKYLMPEDIFYFIYISILIGICLTIFKLVSYILKNIHDYVLNIGGTFSGSTVMDFFKNFRL